MGWPVGRGFLTASITCSAATSVPAAARWAVIDRVQESTAALRDAVVMLDSDGNLEWWNRAAEAAAGPEDPAGQWPGHHQPGTPSALLLSI